MPTPSDLFLSPDLTEEQARAYLQSLGFRDAAAVDEHLQGMADDLVVREALGRLAPDLLPAVLESPDPDAAVAAIAQYVASRSGRGMFLDYLREDPRALHVLTYVMGASPQLADILIRTPEYFHWLVAQVERSAPDRQDHEEELVSAFAAIDDPVEGLNTLRRWKRRETLRIGTRDLLRHETVQTAAAQLSDVASVAIDFALAIVMQQRLDAEAREKPPGTFAVIGTGSLGGREMSYGDDVDLLYVYDTHSANGADAAAAREFFVGVGCDLTAALEDDTHDGIALSRRAAGVAASRWLAESVLAGRIRGALRRVGRYGRTACADEGAADRRRCRAGRAIHGVVSAVRVPATSSPGARRRVSGKGKRAAEEIEVLTQALQLAHGARACRPSAHGYARRARRDGEGGVDSRAGLP